VSIEARFQGRIGAFGLDAAFSCPGRGVTGLFGASGAGKTTILRCLAGLTRPERSFLRVNGEIWQDEGLFLPPHRRPVGVVFQDARLFAHLPVRGNLDYGAKRTDRAGIGFDDAVSLLGLEKLLARAPATLSGGERQRVAIGRALLSQPRLLLMDEPLSALDKDSRQEIFPYLESLARSLSIPVLYVSHELSEIERLADHLLLLGKGGRVEASDTLGALLTDLTLPLARQPDSASVLTVTVAHYDPGYDMSECRLAASRVFVPGSLGAEGTERRLRVKASDVSLATAEPRETSVLNIFRARILSADKVSPSQMLVLVELVPGGPRLLSSMTRKSWDALGLAPGREVFAQVKGMALADPR
jgi:molybdate transport system ATP-binding protein